MAFDFVVTLGCLFSFCSVWFSSCTSWDLIYDISDLIFILKYYSFRADLILGDYVNHIKKNTSNYKYYLQKSI